LLPCQWFLVGIGIGLGARKTAMRKKADFRVTSQEYMGEVHRDMIPRAAADREN
jgi:hypothetical protein